MSDLPPSLRPWSAALSAFVPELALALGPTLRGLAAALGPMSPQPEAQGDAPDGFSGLSRRGSYERLLLSEWALADELPDEFLRRAAASEHLFLQLDRPTPRKGRRCVAWFDAGPDQVGGPRIVHLALLVVLARRAELAGATLEWGHLQHDTLRTGADRAALQALLAGRSPRDPGTSAADRLGHSGPLAGQDELWLVGGPRVPHLRGASRIVASEPLDRPDELDVVLTRAGGASRRLALPLPAPHLRTRLIRAPLAPVPAPPLGHRPGDGPELRFSSNGKWLIRPERRGLLVARPLTQGHPRLFRYNQNIWVPVALGFRRKSTLGLFRHVSRPLYAVIASGAKALEFECGDLHYPGEGPLLEVVGSDPSDTAPVWFRDRAGVVWAWADGRRPRQVETRCVLLAESAKAPIWVAAGPEGTSALYRQRPGLRPDTLCRFDLRAAAAFVGPSLPGSRRVDEHRDTLRIAVVGDGSFQLWSDEAGLRTEVVHALPPGLRVRGLTFTKDLGEALLVTEPDGTDLRLWTADGRGRRLSPGPVRTAIASQGPVARIAWLLGDGSMWTCDATNGDPVPVTSRSTP